MPLKTHQLASVRQEFDWPYQGEAVHIVYNPQGYTPALERKIQEGMKGDFKAEAFVFMLKTMLVDWDLEEFVPKLDGEDNPVTDDAGNPVYVEENGVALTRPYGTSDAKLMELPITFLADCTEAIAKEIKAVSDAGKASTATSPQTAT